MSNKLKTFFAKPKRKQQEKNDSTKEIDVSKYLFEAVRISPKDIDATTSYITNPKFGSFTLQSYPEGTNKVEVRVMNGRRTIQFIYSSDLYEFSKYLVDYCDENGLTFKSSTDRQQEVFAVYR